MVARPIDAAQIAPRQQDRIQAKQERVLFV